MKLRSLFYAVLFAIAPVSAAMPQAVNRSALTTQNNTNITTNNAAQITGAKLNAMIASIIASAGTLLDPQTWTAAQTFSVAPVFSSLTGYCYANAASPVSCATTVPIANVSPLPAGAAFVPTGASVATRTVDAKIRDRLSFEDLGAIGDGVADDGATINAALYARYGGLATTQIQYFVQIEGTPGKTYKFATPVTVRQNRIRFVGNGALIVATGAYAFDITQDSSVNQNTDGLISGWKISGATTAAIRGRAANFWRIENNWITGNVNGIDITAVECQIYNNYVNANTGQGILVQSAIVTGGGVGESQRCIISQNKVYTNGGYGIHLIDGGAHSIINNDLETNTGIELYVQSSFGNQITNLYSEPQAGTAAVVQIDNVVGLYGAARTSFGNQIWGGKFGGNATWDVDIQGGNGNTVGNVVLGAAKIRLAASIAQTVIYPTAGASAPVITDLGANQTVNLSNPQKFTGIVSTSSTKVPVNNGPGFVDFAATDTTKTITFGLAEADAAYQISLTAGTTAGAPAAGSKRVSLGAFPTTGGFTIVNEVAPGAGATVRVWYQIIR